MFFVFVLLILQVVRLSKTWLFIVLMCFGFFGQIKNIILILIHILLTCGEVMLGSKSVEIKSVVSRLGLYTASTGQ